MFWLDEEEFISEEDDKSTKKNWQITRKLIPYFKKYLKKIIIASLLLLCSTLLTLLGPLLIKRVIDVEIPQKNIQALIIIAIIYLLVQIFIILVRYLQQIEIMTIGEKAIADLKADLFQQLLYTPVAYFDENPVGRLISRVESDTETLKFLFSSTAVMLIQNFALIIGMSVVMMIVNLRLFLLISILLPLFLFLFWWFERNVRPIYLSLRKKIAEINAFIIETLKGLTIVQIFRQENNFVSRIDRLGEDKFHEEIKALSYWYRIWFFVDLGEIIGIILILGFGGIWALQGLVTIGSLFLFISYITRLFEPLRGLSGQVDVIERAFASAERVFKILATKKEKGKEEKAAIKKLEKEIAFKNISFFYETNNWVLKNLNFRIKKGERIALVGETGGGKTSIVSLLLKFYAAQRGKIFFDNIPIDIIDRHSLRSRIGFVPQDVILFPGSILNNLRLFDETIPEEKVYEAATRANVHSRILKLHDGYETNIVEQGINLSFGERQLLSYARALVFDPQILILDEATSSVDPQSERLIQKGMKELLKERTAIIIAHRLTTTRLADRILVIHKGKLIEEGNHTNLLHKKGYYHKLYSLQYLSEVV
jgi:ATP-binding cassette subfamily B multidrug efflux pump